MSTATYSAVVYERLYAGKESGKCGFSRRRGIRPLEISTTQRAVCGYYRRHFETPLGLHPSKIDYASGMFVHHKPLPVDVHTLPVEMVRRVVLKRVLPRRDSCECDVRLLSLAVQQALDAFSEARVSKVVT